MEHSLAFIVIEKKPSIDKLKKSDKSENLKTFHNNVKSNVEI